MSPYTDAGRASIEEPELVPMHQSNHPDIPQTLVGVSFENAFRAQEFLVSRAVPASRIADAQPPIGADNPRARSGQRPDVHDLRNGQAEPAAVNTDD